MADAFGGLPVDLLGRVALVLAGAFALVVLYRSGAISRWRGALTARFVCGVPWGTAVVVAWLCFVYFVVQGAWEHPYDPLVVPFRSWSFFYPEGMVFAPFAHSGRGHLVGNLVGTLAFAPIVEYAWGHFATATANAAVDDPPADDEPATTRGWRRRPAGRVAIFVAAVFGVGLVTSLFVPGPLIGFSGVIFAFAGVALVVYPVATVLAILGSNALSLVYRSWTDPVSIAEASQRFISPPWSDVAVQGHALGLLVGIGVGVVLLRRRDRELDTARVLFAGVVYGVAQGLYLFFWPVGPSRFAMFRAVGLAAIVFFATLLAVALSGSDRRLVPDRWPSDSGLRNSLGGVTRPRAALALLLVPIVVLAAVAVPFNAVLIDDANVDSGVEVGDYRITYAEGVPDLSVPAIRLPVVNRQFRVERSGVIVVNEDRNVWEEVVPKGGLAFRGQARVTVGGLGWRETVSVNRTTWTVVDGGKTYTVYVRRPGEARQQVYIDDPVRVPAVLDGKRVVISPTGAGYELHVTRNESVLDSAPVPEPGTNVTLANLTVERRGTNLVASFDRTRITIARLELRERGN